MSNESDDGSERNHVSGVIGTGRAYSYEPPEWVAIGTQAVVRRRDVVHIGLDKTYVEPPAESRCHMVFARTRTFFGKEETHRSECHETVEAARRALVRVAQQLNGAP